MQNETTLDVRVTRVNDAAILPIYATGGSGCFDLHCVLDESYGGCVYLENGQSQSFKTGLAFEVPKGHVMLIFSRSGSGFNFDVRLANCVGVIDSDYRGEVCVKLSRDDFRQSGDVPKIFPVKTGDRIAQAMIIPVPSVRFVLADALSTTARGMGGFGSTGK